MYEQIISQYNTILCSVKNKTTKFVIVYFFNCFIFVLGFSYYYLLCCWVFNIFWFLVDNDCHYNTREFVYQ